MAASDSAAARVATSDRSRAFSSRNAVSRSRSWWFSVVAAARVAPTSTTVFCFDDVRPQLLDHRRRMLEHGVRLRARIAAKLPAERRIPERIGSGHVFGAHVGPGRRSRASHVPEGSPIAAHPLHRMCKKLEEGCGT